MEKKVEKSFVDIRKEIDEIYQKLDETGAIIQGLVDDYDELVGTSSRKPLFKGLKKQQRRDLGSKLLKEKHPKMGGLVDVLYEYGQCLNEAVGKVEDVLNEAENKLDGMEEQLEDIKERKESLKSEAEMLY